VSGDRVVAIDGGAGSGKSTLAKLLARRLGLAYLNTGLMYRAVAAEARRRGVDVDDEQGLAPLCDTLRFTLSGDSTPALEVQGWSQEALSSPEVEGDVSVVSSHQEVRARLREAQRTLGAPGAVVEGRDIGSVVFPDAAVKLYLIADAGARARRRSLERGDDVVATGAALRVRDALDGRTTPAVAPEGAHVLDTTDLSVEGMLEEALRIVKRQAPGLAS